MKTTLVLLLVIALLFSLIACSNFDGFEENRDEVWDSNPYARVKIVLNGDELDRYTHIHGEQEEYAYFPVGGFLSSIGAEEMTPPANNGFNTECYTFMGKRYVKIDARHIFVPESDYYALLDQLEQDGKRLSQLYLKDLSDFGLLPLSESKFYSDDFDGQGMMTDHISMMNALIESGIDIQIAYDYANEKLYVTL